jgi:hypothetical protein
MQLNFRLLSVVALTVFTTFTACKKDSSSQQQQDPAAQLSSHSDDEARVSSEMDAVNWDMNVALESTATFSGRLENELGFGATISYDTTGSIKKLTITYTGDDSTQTKTRSGSVVVTIPAGVRWKDAGATVTITYNNLKIVRKSDNKSITINGTHTLTNVSGGLVRSLPNSQEIVHTLSSSNMSITFDDGTQRNWQVAHRRVYTYSGGLIITTTGTHTEGTQTNIAEWGTDRFGRTFTTAITEPLRIKQECNFRLTSGQVTHTTAGLTATVTFGLNADGIATTCPGTGHYYYKLVVTGPNGTPFTIILPY